MPWVRIDDHFDEHPKIAKVGPLGIALWLAGLAYCNRNLTDGFIPWAVAQKLVNWQFLGEADETGQRKVYTIGVSCGMAGEDVETEHVIPLLIRAELWEQIDGGFYVHDYPDYQMTKAQIEELSETKRRAGQAGAKASAVARARASAQAKLQPNTNTNTNPVPDPDPSSRCLSADIKFGDFCKLYEAEIGPITGIVGDRLKELADEVPLRWFEEALKIAVKNGKRKLAYVEGILKNYKAEGFNVEEEREEGNGGDAIARLRAEYPRAFAKGD